MKHLALQNQDCSLASKIETNQPFVFFVVSCVLFLPLAQILLRPSSCFKNPPTKIEINTNFNCHQPPICRASQQCPNCAWIHLRSSYGSGSMIRYTILITNMDDWNHHPNRVAQLAFLIWNHRAIYLSGIHLTKPPILRFTLSSYIHLIDLASSNPTCQKIHKVANFPNQTKSRLFQDVRLARPQRGPFAINDGFWILAGFFGSQRTMAGKNMENIK